MAKVALADVRKKRGLSSDAEVWVIGDTPADVKCGRAIDATVVAVATGLYSIDELESCDPDFLCENFADVELILEIFPGA